MTIVHDSQLPNPVGTQLLVDVRGAEIIHSHSDEPEVYLPMHEEVISHIALDIGGSLAKVVYFTRVPTRSANKDGSSTPEVSSPAESAPVWTEPRRVPTPPDSPAKPNGILGPRGLSLPQNQTAASSGYRPPSPTSTRPSASTSSTSPTQRTSASPAFQSRLRRRHSSSAKVPPGGRLNFIKFETSDLSSCISFLSTLISSSAASNGVSLQTMKNNVKIMATGGGAHRFYERLRDELGVEVRREEEMECLVLGLGFVIEVPNEVFWYSDELVQAISHPQYQPPTSPTISASSSSPPTSHSANDPFPRPSPNPPQYSISFDPSPRPGAQFPCLLVNIGSGVSIIKVDDFGKFERISGTSLGGGTLWGLLSLLTGAKSFDDMLALADEGDNSSVDMLVGDIYGQDYQKIGLKSSTIASSFGKVFRKDGELASSHPTKSSSSKPNGEQTSGEDGEEGRKHTFKPEDISKSLLYAISNNIGQIAYMNAEKHNLDRIYFGGGFIRGHAATISTLSYAIRFWSKGTKKALFLRHEGYLGGIGAWLKNELGESDEDGGRNGGRRSSEGGKGE